MEANHQILQAAPQTENDPHTQARDQFYLAQSYRDCGEKEKALEAYLKRAELGFEIEEVFLSLYYAAKLRETLGRPFDDVMATYRRAADTVPSRLEALHGASRYCRLSKRHKEGYEIAKRARLPGEAPDGLFIEPWVYEYGLLDEFAVNAYWAGAYQDCLDACERILRERKCPEVERPRIEANAAFARHQLGIGNVAVSAADVAKKQEEGSMREQPRIVATMTTIPSRIDLIRPVIDSVLAQTVPIQHIELNIPYHCIRTDETYHLPGWLESMDRVQIFRTEDYGPITKVAPTLLRYQHDPETYIWSVDDDIAYPSDHLEQLCRAHDPTKPRILTRYGGMFQADGTAQFFFGEREVTTFVGFGGVLYPPGCIGEDFRKYLSVTSANADCRKNDDVVLSMYFNACGVPMYLYRPLDYDAPLRSGELPQSNRDDALHSLNPDWMETYKRIFAVINSLQLLSNPSEELKQQHGAFLDPALLAKSGRKIYSQNDEDGIIEFLISALGLASGYFVEIGVGPPSSVMTADGGYRRGSLEQDGLEANCRLLLERGWHGFMLDAEKYPDGAGVFQEFVTALNVNHVLQRHQCPSEVDIFSLDIDGQDFWVWMNLILRPKIMIIEYNGELDFDESLVVPFDTGFRWDYTYYQGASLLALKKLGESKFYSLVHANGVNAFFVRADLISNHDEFTVEQIYRKLVLHHRDKQRRPWVLI